MQGEDSHIYQSVRTYVNHPPRSPQAAYSYEQELDFAKLVTYRYGRGPHAHSGSGHK